MSKIATYSLADSPLQLSDRLIGTEAPRPTPSSTPLATKNFSLQELLQLFSANFPAATLQAVLDAGNIATQNITLTGTISATLIKPVNIEDISGSQGSVFQVLSKAVSGVNWVNLPSASWGSITGTITLQTDLINYLSTNYFANPTGTISQYIRGNGSLATFPTVPVVVPSALTKTDDTNVTLTLGGFPSISLLEPVSLTLGWTGTLADSRIASASVWNAKQNALGYVPVPISRTLTINGTSYDLSADRSWTIAAGVTSISAISPIISSGGATPVISTLMATNKLIGRSTAGSGVMEEITLGSGLSLVGGILTASGASPLTTKGDLYTFSTVDARLPIGLDTQVLIADSSTSTGLKWGTNTAPTPLGYYAQYFSYVNQSCATNNVGKAMIFETPDLSNGVTVVSDGTNLTKITFANTGKYNLQFSTQFKNTDNAEQDVYIWIRKNGVTSAEDVIGSTGLVTIPKTHGGGSGTPGHNIVSWNFLLDIVAGDFYQIVWSTADVAKVTIAFFASTVNHPSTASTLFTVTQQAGIMAGTGMTSLTTTGTSGPATYNSGTGALNIPQYMSASTRKNANNSSNNNINYCGVALGTGVSESATVWTITRLTIAASGSITTATATNVAWTNRESAIYT